MAGNNWCRDVESGRGCSVVKDMCHADLSTQFSVLPQLNVPRASAQREFSGRLSVHRAAGAAPVMAHHRPLSWAHFPQTSLYYFIPKLLYINVREDYSILCTGSLLLALSMARTSMSGGQIPQISWRSIPPFIWQVLIVPR